MQIFLVRPHPPANIIAKSCPAPEVYKYNWQPMALKYIAYQLRQSFGNELEIKLWHLMDEQDDTRFLKDVREKKPDIVAFSEIDILVNEVNRLATLIKKIQPQIWTVVGGKHTSLIREGDKFPYRHIDFAIRGEGISSLQKLINARKNGTLPHDAIAIIRVNTEGRVAGEASYDKRCDFLNLNGISLQQIPVENHPMEEYLEIHQIHPALISDKTRTASVFAGYGCPYQCIFCQSPVEYGAESRAVQARPPEQVAEEIAWLVKTYDVNNIFSLEPNLNLQNWLKIYEFLAKDHQIFYLPVSGFIRAADVLEAYRKGMLTGLIQKGMRVLSIGLDIPYASAKDVYRKAFSFDIQMEALRICEELGIAVMATFIGDPDYTSGDFGRQLQYLQEIPIAGIDIRLAIALRNTQYYQQISSHFIFHPDRHRLYYNRQNYRYQTIRIPGKITPRQTYGLVRRFYRQFFTADKHLDYVLRFIQRYPESRNFFLNHYTPVLKKSKRLPAKLQKLAGLFQQYEVAK